MKKKVFTYTNFEGHWPVGTVGVAAVIIAESRKEAIFLLGSESRACGFKLGDTPILTEISTAESEAFILTDGNY